MKREFITICAVVLMVSSLVSAADFSGWNAYVIRNSNVGNITPVISDDASGGKLFQIVLGGQKAGWGTNQMNGKTIGDIYSSCIIRDSSVTGWGPYMNIWVADGEGGYAVLANEPSHTWEYPPDTAYCMSWDVMQNATSWVYEVSSTVGFRLPDGTKTYVNKGAGTLNPFKFKDFKNYTIATPSSHWGGTGAPDDLNASTYTAYGVNWIFGDTQSNYVGGYLVSAPTLQSIGINVFASSAANVSGSPSWSAYVVNALNSLENGLGNIGDRTSDPTAYEVAPSVVGPGEIAVTSFKSWRGIVNPPSPFHNELGNRMHFGLHAVGNGTQQFTLEDLTFALHSSDPYDSLIFVGDFIGYNYSATRYGIDWGADRAKGGGDDTKYTSGNGTTLVDEIVYVGVGNAWWPGGGDPNPANPVGGAQAAMDDYFAWIASYAPDNVNVTCTYNILSMSGSDSTTVAADNILKLNVEDDSIYVKPGENVITDMDVLSLIQKVNSCQAMLGYSSTYLQASAGCVVAGGGVWDELIYNSWDVGSGIPGEIDTAIGIDADSTTTGTDADGTVAVITLQALTAGVTQIVFRPDVSGDETQQTFLSDMSSQAVWPIKVDSVTIVIDGTNPIVAVTYPNGGENLKGGSTCTITWTATDTYIDADSVKLEYYDGSAWVEIASGENNDGSYDWTVPSLDISTAKVRVSVSDLAGNTGSDESDAAFTIDSTNPVVGAISATQFGGPELTPSGSGNAVQGVVNIAVATSDNLSGVAGAPTVTVVDSASSPMAVTYTGQGPANTFNYTVTVLSTTANGVATITVSGLTDNAGNVAGSSNDTFDINKNQITGSVDMSTQSTAAYSFNRDVVFKATDGSGTVIKSWTVTVNFTNNTGTKIASGSYALTDVPGAIANLSAKTAWSLRKRNAAVLDGSGQAAVNFTLAGGDLNGSNAINILDYSVFKINYGTSNPAGDINGNGGVDATDYFILRQNFFTTGDAE